VTPDPDQTSTGQPTSSAAADGLGSHPPIPATSTDVTAGASPQERLAAIANERPEAAVGAAFAGGLLLALILKRLAH
jgi:hypothetical protein